MVLKLSVGSISMKRAAIRSLDPALRYSGYGLNLSAIGRPLFLNPGIARHTPTRARRAHEYGQADVLCEVPQPGCQLLLGQAPSTALGPHGCGHQVSEPDVSNAPRSSRSTGVPTPSRSR